MKCGLVLSSSTKMYHYLPYFIQAGQTSNFTITTPAASAVSEGFRAMWHLVQRRKDAIVCPTKVTQAVQFN